MYCRYPSIHLSYIVHMLQASWPKVRSYLDSARAGRMNIENIKLNRYTLTMQSALIYVACIRRHILTYAMAHTDAPLATLHCIPSDRHVGGMHPEN